MLTYWILHYLFIVCVNTKFQADIGLVISTLSGICVQLIFPSCMYPDYHFLLAFFFFFYRIRMYDLRYFFGTFFFPLHKITFCLVARPAQFPAGRGAAISHYTLSFVWQWRTVCCHFVRGRWTYLYFLIVCHDCTDEWCVYKRLTT